jgi:pimeloyl-ACP methyl ester carboxylesterase
MPAPVVLIHDLRGSARQWADATTALSAAGHTVIAPDLPGHGSRVTAPLTLETILDTIATATIEAAEAPVVVGIGVGAHLAIASVARSKSARAVVAIGCGTEPLSWLLDSYRISSAAMQLLPDGGNSVSEWAGRTFAGQGAGTPEFRAVVGKISQLDVRQSLKLLGVPVTLINGSRDRFRMQERAFTRAAHDGRLVRVAGVARAEAPTTVRALAETIDALTGEIA